MFVEIDFFFRVFCYGGLTNETGLYPLYILKEPLITYINPFTTGRRIFQAIIQAHWTHQILVTCIFPTPCNHFHTHLVVYRARTSKCCVFPILNKYRPVNSHDLVVRHTISRLISRLKQKLKISHDGHK